MIVASTKVLHYPKLDTILMVEEFIKENSGRYQKSKLWRHLPKQMMYQTYRVIFDYLRDSGKLDQDREGKVVWTVGRPPEAAETLFTERVAGQVTGQSSQRISERVAGQVAGQKTLGRQSTPISEELYQAVIKPNRGLFWSLKDQRLVSLELAVEVILNHGDWPAFEKLVELVSLEVVAGVFRRQTSRPRHNYDPLTQNYFTLYFDRHLPEHA